MFPSSSLSPLAHRPRRTVPQSSFFLFSFFVFSPVLLGILHFDLLVHDATSLKDKRRVIASVKDRLHREHMAAVAEVGHQEMLNVARMGLAVVGSDGKHLGAMLDRITSKLRTLRDAELGETCRRVVDFDDIEGDDAEGAESPRDDALLAAEMLRRASEIDSMDDGATTRGHAA